MADTKIKITEVQTTETVKPDAYTLITQEDDNEVETLYRAQIQSQTKPFFKMTVNHQINSLTFDYGTAEQFDAFVDANIDPSCAQKLNSDMDILFLVYPAYANSFTVRPTIVDAYKSRGKWVLSLEYTGVGTSALGGSDMLCSCWLTYKTNVTTGRATMGGTNYVLTKAP